MTGVGPGSGTIAANFGNVQVFTGTLCPPQTCPVAAESASSTANVDYLTCGAATRGSSLTCQINNLPPGATISNWKFTAGTNTVTTPSTSSSWSGTAVQSGTVSVTVTSGGMSGSLSSAWTVNGRSGWAFTAVQPVKVANGAGTGACAGGLILLVSPPTATSGNIGYSCLGLEWSYKDSSVSGGPNNGYWYTTSGSSSSSAGVSTAYQWERVPDLDNTSSTFYTQQTGTYNAQTDPSGCITGSNLATQTQRHEIGLAQSNYIESHWGEYQTALNNPSNNFGTIMEASVGAPSGAQSGFEKTLNTALSNAQTAIANAFLVDPYDVNRNEYDVLLGYINYAPSYNSCK